MVETLYAQIAAIFTGIHVYAIGKYANGPLVSYMCDVARLAKPS